MTDASTRQYGSQGKNRKPNNGQATRKKGETKYPKSVYKATWALIPRPQGKDSADGYRRKLEVARQHVAERVGSSALEEMIRTIGSNGPDRLLAWEGVSEELGRDFGHVYVARTGTPRKLAIYVLEAQRAHLIDVSKFQWNRPKSSAQSSGSPRTTRRKSGRKPRKN